MMTATGAVTGGILRTGNVITIRRLRRNTPLKYTVGIHSAAPLGSLTRGGRAAPGDSVSEHHRANEGRHHRDTADGPGAARLYNLLREHRPQRLSAQSRYWRVLTGLEEVLEVTTRRVIPRHAKGGIVVRGRVA
jgi:hypothetical protein